MTDSEKREVFHAGFWAGANEYGAGGDEVTDEEVDALFDEWAEGQP